MLRYKIAIIIPYFGKFPKWIDLFLYSCSRNAKLSEGIEVDWLIFTDCVLPERIYPNTHFIISVPLKWDELNN